MRFQLLNEKRFPIIAKTINANKDLLPFYRWEHRVTVGYKGKQYMAFVDALNTKCYIEEVTSGDLKVIQDDDLFEELHKYMEENGYIAVMQPLMKDSKQRFI